MPQPLIEEQMNAPATNGALMDTPAAQIKEDERENPGALPPEADSDLLPIVGLGGSAGSIEVLGEFFGAIASDSGLAFVVVVHLAPDFDSQLAPILQRRTKMPVIEVLHPQKVEPNHVYVIPPGFHLAMSHGTIRLEPFENELGKRVAVDLFFRTLADSHRSKAVAVVLSGLDSDGAIGIKRIKENGGVTVAQAPEEAAHEGMPRAAIQTGMVDWVLPVAQIVRRLEELARNEPKIHLPPSILEGEGSKPNSNGAHSSEVEEAALREIVSHLRVRTRHDFTHYKRATVLRRIMRRLQVNSLATLPDYLHFLRTNAGEVSALLGDLLISVTNFFRDPESFGALEKQLPALFRGKTEGDQVRVWAPGCATGEEAYSLAMLLVEYAETRPSPPTIQLFATDIDEEALRVAREGRYPQSIVADLSPERLRRFFQPDQRMVRVRADLRDIVLFASHNLLSDPPFSRMDLISCRNLLIYFDRDAQEKALSVFHFALQPEGTLFLGGSESPDGSELFAPLDKKHRIYTRRSIPRPAPPLPISFPSQPLSLPNWRKLVGAFAPPLPSQASIQASIQAPGQTPSDRPAPSPSELHLHLLELMAPPSVLINTEYEILHLSPSAGKFLGFVGGNATTNLVSVAQPSLRLELRSALFRALQSGEDVDVPGATVRVDGHERAVDIRVRPLREDEQPIYYLLVVFEERSDVAPTAIVQRVGDDDLVRRLDRELSQMKAYLRQTIELYESTTEELKASNEELQAVNEELRSAGEELEISREELQASNEELLTVNAEMKLKVDQLSLANADLQNLITSTDIATVFLDRDLRVKRFTPRALDLFRLEPTDLGRPLSDLRNRLDISDAEFIADAARVLDQLTTIEREIRSNDGHFYLLRVSPYRTGDGRIDGAVLAFVDITGRRATEETLRQSEERLRLVLESVTEYAIITLDLDGRISGWNSGAQRAFGWTSGEALGQRGAILFTPEDRDASVPGEEMRIARTEGRAVDERWHVHKDNSRLFMSGVLSPLRVGEQLTGYVKIARDLTEQQQTQRSLRESEERFRAIVSQATVSVMEMDLTGRFTFVNQALCDATGYTAAELIVLSLSDITYADDQPRCLQLFQQTIATGAPMWNEKRIVRKDGSLLWMTDSVSGLRDDCNRAHSVVAVAIDVTERKRAEEALRQSEEQHRALIEQASVGIAQCALDGHILVSNEQLGHVLGYTTSQLAQMNLQSLMHPDDLPLSLEKWDHMTAYGTPFDIKTRYIRKDGTLLWANASVSPVRDAQGQPQLASVVIVDITARQQAEEELRRAHAELEEHVMQRTEELRHALFLLREEIEQREHAEAGRDKLLAQLVTAQEEERRRISRELHDNMGQHLTAILLAIQSVEAQNEQLSFPDRRSTSGRLTRLRSMVDELLTVSHRLAWELRPASLDNVGLKAALEQYVSSWKHKSGTEADFIARLRGEKTSLPPEAETALFRVAQEALTNVQRHAGATQVSVVLEQNEEGVVVIVEDNGRGLDLERGDTSSRLGLLGMRERLELVGGALTIESELGEGLAVYARVPLPKER